MSAASLFKYCFHPFIQSDSQDLSILDEQSAKEVKEVRRYLEREKTGLMCRLSMYARLMSMDDADLEKAPVSEDENIDNSLLSQILLTSKWMNYRQIEPQDVLNFMKSIADDGETIMRFENNMKSVVLIGHKSLFDANGHLIYSPLRDVQISGRKEDIGPDVKSHKKMCLVDRRFPFINQMTVQRNLAKEEEPPLPVFYGTGFFVDKNTVATAGHVIAAMAENLIRYDDPTFVAVQYYRLSSRDGDLLPLKKYTIQLDTLTVGENTQDSDHGYFSVDGVSDHFVTMANEAHCGMEVYAMGHGLGLPLKMAWNGLLFQNNETSFRCKLETFGGNSGSPVFCSQTHRVIGILSGNDKVENQPINSHRQKCYVMPKVYLHGYNGAVCTKIGSFMTKMNKIN